MQTKAPLLKTSERQGSRTKPDTWKMRTHPRAERSQELQQIHGNQFVQRFVADGQSGRAKRSAAPPIVNEVLRAGGTPLEPKTRFLMESRFVQDLSRVKIHTDTKAAESAEAINAWAYTVGTDVVFGAGAYQPYTLAGQRLLAHELTHVAQSSAFAKIQSSHLTSRGELSIGPTKDASEKEADDMEESQGKAVSAAPDNGAPVVRRKISKGNTRPQSATFYVTWSDYDSDFYLTLVDSVANRFHIHASKLVQPMHGPALEFHRERGRDPKLRTGRRIQVSVELFFSPGDAFPSGIKISSPSSASSTETRTRVEASGGGRSEIGQRDLPPQSQIQGNGGQIDVLPVGLMSQDECLESHPGSAVVPRHDDQAEDAESNQERHLLESTEQLEKPLERLIVLLEIANRFGEKAFEELSEVLEHEDHISRTLISVAFLNQLQQELGLIQAILTFTGPKRQELAEELARAIGEKDFLGGTATATEILALAAKAALGVTAVMTQIATLASRVSSPAKSLFVSASKALGKLNAGVEAIELLHDLSVLFGRKTDALERARAEFLAAFHGIGILGKIKLGAEGAELLPEAAATGYLILGATGTLAFVAGGVYAGEAATARVDSDIRSSYVRAGYAEKLARAATGSNQFIRDALHPERNKESENAFALGSTYASDDLNSMSSARRESFVEGLKRRLGSTAEDIYSHVFNRLGGNSHRSGPPIQLDKPEDLLR